MVVSNQLNRFLDDELDFGQVNYRIWRLWVDADSYMARSVPVCRGAPLTACSPFESGRALLRTEIIVGASIGGVVLLVFLVALVIRSCAPDDERYQALPQAD